jgi:hypothetical protein
MRRIITRSGMPTPFAKDEKGKKQMQSEMNGCGPTVRYDDITHEK